MIFLKKHNIFKSVGECCYYQSNILPAEPFLVSFGNNVSISAGVRIVTHSMTNTVFNIEENTKKYRCRYGEVRFGNNIYVGANAIINFDVSIGDNSIIAAGAVVTKDVPSGSVVGGVPAKVIGSYKKAKENLEEFSKQYWELGLTDSCTVEDMYNRLSLQKES